MATNSERAIPSGMRCDGSSTSSAALATFVSPPYETNTSPTTANTPDEPVVKNGSRFEPSKPRDLVSSNPETRNQPRTATTNATRQSCNEALAFEPAMLTTMNSVMSTRARERLSMSTISTR